MIDIGDIGKKMKKLKCLVVGDVGVDFFTTGTYDGFSREISSQPIFRWLPGKENNGGRNYSLGGAGNLAVNLSTYLDTVYLVGTIGGEDDPFSYAMRMVFDRYDNIEPHMVVYDYTRVFGKIMFPEPHTVFRVDYAPVPLEHNKESELIMNIKGLLDEVDFVAVADYDEHDGGVCTRNIVEYLSWIDHPTFATSREHIGNYTSYKRFDHLIVNRQEYEAAEMGGGKLEPSKDGSIVVTMEGEGCKVETGGEVYTVESIEVYNKIDPCGCGDAFYSIYASAICAGVSPEEAAKMATSGARHVVQILGNTGTAPISSIKAQYIEIYGAGHPL